jgi:ADP-L-glycero-D-manno-heptose 6-epimerase
MELKDHAACLRLFNVYGPNEYHKGRMASTIFHWYKQISDTGSIKIFEGSDEFFRDFIYVEDVCRTFWHFTENFKPGVYDVGTGKQESFEHVADCLIEAMGEEVYKEYIPMPDDLNKQYQKSTRANLTALDKAGFVTDTYRSVLEGIEDYVGYLKTNARL